MKHLYGAAMSTLLLTFTAAAAQAQDAVIQPHYPSMSCLQTIEEINAASEILGGAPERGLISTGHAVNLATNVGQRLALDAGHGGLSTGVGLAGRLVGSASRRRAEQQAAEREQATRRWYYLSGLYDGRDCDNRLADEIADMQAAQAETGPAANPH